MPLMPAASLLIRPLNDAHVLPSVTAPEQPPPPPPDALDGPVSQGEHREDSRGKQDRDEGEQDDRQTKDQQEGQEGDAQRPAGP